MKNLKEIGTISPKLSSEIEYSKFCVGFETLDRNTFDPEKVYDYVAQSGVKWARVQSGWMKTEKEAGVYDFEWLDKIVDNLISRGVNVWLDVGYSNPVHVKDCVHPFGIGFPPIRTPEQKKGWKDYVTALVKHYKGKINDYEVWNEPDWAYWVPENPNPRELGEFVAETARIIKSANADAKVTINFASGASDPDCTRYFDTAMFYAAKDVDFISFHVYGVSPETGLDKLCEVTRKILDRYNPNVKIIQGESGTQSRPDGFGAMCNMPWTETKQAKWLLRRMFYDSSKPDIYMTSYFTMCDIATYPGRNAPEPFCYTGVIRGGTYKPKKAFYALQNVCALLSGELEQSGYYTDFFKLNSKMPYFKGTEDTCTCPEKLKSVALVTEDKKPVIAWWYPSNLLKEKFSKTVSLAAYIYNDALPENPVLIDPLEGKIYEIPKENILIDADDGNTFTLFGYDFRRTAYTAYETCPGKVYRFLNLPVKDYPLVITDASHTAAYIEGKE